jgi:hypothetical protein
MVRHTCFPLHWLLNRVPFYHCYTPSPPVKVDEDDLTLRFHHQNSYNIDRKEVSSLKTEGLAWTLLGGSSEDV